MFNALLINKDNAGYRCTVEELDATELMAGDVEIDVLYSTLNYKDALAITGKAPVVRHFPMVPGIDFVGKVSRSEHADYRTGQLVVLNGWGVGEGHFGGLSQKARVKGDWLVPLPDSFDAKQAMAIGTAGYTAMLCVMALEAQGVTPEQGPILVTGAAGGVGSVAIAILAKLGYQVTALSGRVESQKSFLLDLGASDVIARDEFTEQGKPLQKERFAGAIDVVGSHVLANICASLKYGGTVAACGLAGGMDLPATVAPFILRGVTLAGVDSVMCPRDKRITAWQRLEKDLDIEKLNTIFEEVSLSEAIDIAPDILAGKVRGRVIVDVNR